MTEPVFTVANQLTMLRMALAPLLVLLVLDRQFSWALVVFVVAGLTDALDGYVARHAGQSTTLGAMLDPVADKIFVGSSYAVLTWSAGVTFPLPVWLTVTLLFRDAMLLVAVVVVNLTIGRRVYQPSRLGKVSTFLNVGTGGVALLVNAMGECPRGVRWLYVTTLVMIIASTIHYLYLASERAPRQT
jgi:cardiolipin synthase